MKFTFQSMLLLVFGRTAYGLYAAKGSPCIVPCGTKAQNFTGVGDLVCLDTQYSAGSGDVQGILYQGCLTCLSNSTYYDPTSNYYSNSDQFWFLWHMKYVQQYCLIDTPQTTAASNCASLCDPMAAALDTSWIYKGIQEQYAYCNFNNSQFTQYAQDCASCLQNQEQGVVIGNFMDIMWNACQSKPMAQQDQLVVFTKPLFDSALASSMTSLTMLSSSTGTTTSDIHVTSSMPLTTSFATIGMPGETNAVAAVDDASKLSIGAAAGIGVAATVVVIGTTLGITIVVMRHRKRKTEPLVRSQYTEMPAFVSPEPPFEKGHDRIAVQEMDAKGVQVYEMASNTSGTRYAPDKMPNRNNTEL